MATTYKRVTKIVFLVLNLITSVLFLLACLAPYLDPEKWWLISLMGLGFALIIVTLFAFILFWLFFGPRYIFLSIIPLLIGWKSISVFFAFHTPNKFDYTRDKSSIRVVHWNVARFLEWKRNNNKKSQVRLKMMDQLKEQNADVLCMQEFFSSTDSQYYNNLSFVMKELGYPYYFYSRDHDGAQQYVGQVIFSRLPIIDSGMIRYPEPSMPEALIHVDLKCGNDTLRIFTTHLQSVQFKKKDYEQIEAIKAPNEKVVENSRNIFSKLKKGIILRSLQARILKEQLAASPYPVILTGDMNDVPNSYTYHTIVNDQLQDVFLQTGFGVGRTFNNLAPTLRIDYIFTSRDFKVRQFNRIAKNLSDHYMLVSDLQLIK
jgi:endonuclease/exonuclease/phosphatase family metal-dependent hydrolase